MLERAGLSLLHRMDPERAHGLALRALQMGFGPKPGPITSPRLECSFAGLSLPNPLGLAAGFDKNAVAVDALSAAGFGFIEVGAATPQPQPGNPRPRMFRLPEDGAVINRFGFNNDGVDAIAGRLAARKGSGVVGLNLGANKDSDDKAADFAAVLRRAGPHVDFATVNVSSPNTEKLRDLQGAEALSALLNGVMEARQGNTRIFLKIAPDLTEAELADIAKVAQDTGIDGIVATNTTLSRAGLQNQHAQEAGGLSGAPVFERSTQVLRDLWTLTGGTVPLMGVGGIASGKQAHAKIRAGASAVQLYTALGYHGLSLVGTILDELERLLAADGFVSVVEAVGADHR
ncbi:quinone-dependent dihydroorotate dehydrogenase [Pontivivens insulae]|uniref:Dihydroorotate dehydrogenase (quinone) n=1 Tax=Pontivivens insulae TaxID=1639689 RepID=A0A2R8AEC2_9RHOB|nr:quinone-dependent dihydroorotate dehydrogenase [Pontivivens insulae]RED14313.1 dihydroorotate oxidase A [Pontivivens insulae]SPF30390.1 Dihydroorotate dehydrogenase (quinone) [Pontivivens insulae]